MGAIKDLMMKFTAVVFPDDYDKQDELFVFLMQPNDRPEIPNITIEQYREAFEKGEAPTIGLEEMQRLVESFDQPQTAPALKRMPNGG